MAQHSRTIIAALAASGVFALSAPAAAQADYYYPRAEPSGWEQRVEECHAMYPERARSGVGGALIGGAVGGFAGNRIAGKGSRTVGTVLGAVGGAVAGAVIDRAVNDRRSRDECEDVFDRPGAPNAQGGYHHGGYHQGAYYPPVPGYENGFPPGSYRVGNTMMVPIKVQPPCEEIVTTTEEWVPEYVTVRPRPIPPRAKPVPDKRMRVPDKRIKVN